MSDVYSHEVAIPPSPLTGQYFQQLANHLKPSGLLVVNIIANPLFNSTYSQRVHNTLQRVFPYCVVFPLSIADAESNSIYLCPKIKPGPSEYTDNLSSATFDFFTSRQNAAKSRKSQH